MFDAKPGPPKHINDPPIKQAMVLFYFSKQSIEQSAALFDRTWDESFYYTHVPRLSTMKMATDQILAAGSWCKRQLNSRRVTLPSNIKRRPILASSAFAFFWRVKRRSLGGLSRAKGELPRSKFPNEATSGILQHAKGNLPRIFWTDVNPNESPKAKSQCPKPAGVSVIQYWRLVFACPPSGGPVRRQEDLWFDACYLVLYREEAPKDKSQIPMKHQWGNSLPAGP